MSHNVYDFVLSADIANLGAEAAKNTLRSALGNVPYVGAILGLLNDEYWTIIQRDIRERQVGGRICVRVKEWRVLMIAYHAIEIGAPDTAYYPPAAGGAAAPAAALHFNHVRKGTIQHHYPHDHPNTAIEFVGHGGQHWHGEMHARDIFLFYEEDGFNKHFNFHIDFCGWDDAHWIATINPDGKSFHFKPADGNRQAEHDGPVLNYKHWNGAWWQATLGS